MAPHATGHVALGYRDHRTSGSDHANGFANGRVNGLANGHAAVGTNGLTNGHALSKTESRAKRHPDTGISVLIAGGGMGGMTAALECWRKGHSPRVLERSSEPHITGDTFGIQPSAFKIFRHWPRLTKEIEEIEYDTQIRYYRHNGELVYGPCPPKFNDAEDAEGRLGPHVSFAHSRVKLHQALLRQAARCGIPVEYGAVVEDYFEDLARDKAGVILEDGRRYTADVVIAADGIKTRSGEIVAGSHLEPRASGHAIYRTAYPAELALKNPIVRDRWMVKEGEKPKWDFFMGPGMHVAVMFGHDLVGWALTHKDDGTARETWNPEVSADEVLDVMEREAPGWDPALRELFSTAPKGNIIHWKLMWRDLRRQWTSPGGRVVQLGDAVHSFLPASGSGATQAMEDATTIAACLQLGGRANVPAAMRTYNLLRVDRISCAQKMSFVNSQAKQATDWDKVKQNPVSIRTRFPKWMFKHDPEAYAYDNFGRAFLNVVAGEPFENSNTPPGHKIVPWTIDEILEDIRQGKKVELDGDWS